jgi:hypothetical protein
MRQRLAVARGNNFPPAAAALLLESPAVLDARLHGDRVEIDLAPDASLAPLIRLLVEAGAELEEVRRSRGTLEEVILALMTETD